MRSYLLQTLKGILFNRRYFLLNVFGLGIALSTIMLIAAYVVFEYSYDGWVNDAVRIYRSETISSRPGMEGERYAGTTGVLAAALQAYFAQELEAVTRVYTYDDNVRRGDAQFNESIHYVDADFFDIFSLE